MKNKKNKIGNHSFEEVGIFKYLGMMLSNDGRREDEIKKNIEYNCYKSEIPGNKRLIMSRYWTIGKKC